MYQIFVFQCLNLDLLCYEIMNYFENLFDDVEVEDDKQDVEFLWDIYCKDFVDDFDYDDDDWDDEDDDDYDVEVIYRK